MPCDTRLKAKQTLQERAAEVRAAVERIQRNLMSGRVKAVVGAKGGIAFQGITEQERDGVTDNCIYRRIMATGSAMAKMKIAQAEQLAGRTVDKQAVATGLHSHDGGATWSRHEH